MLPVGILSRCLALMTDAEENYIYGTYTPDDTEQCASAAIS
jgi:hypothetical protein